MENSKGYRGVVATTKGVGRVASATLGALGEYTRAMTLL